MIQCSCVNFMCLVTTTSWSSDASSYEDRRKHFKDLNYSTHIKDTITSLSIQRNGAVVHAPPQPGSSSWYRTPEESEFCCSSLALHQLLLQQAPDFRQPCERPAVNEHSALEPGAYYTNTLRNGNAYATTYLCPNLASVSS